MKSVWVNVIGNREWELNDGWSDRLGGSSYTAMFRYRGRILSATLVATRLLRS